MASKKKNDYSKLFGELDLPKDRFDRNREGYVDDKGNYHYITGTKKRGATPDVIPLKNKDGSSNANLITMLANMDHAVNIQKRNVDDHEDARNKAFKANTDPDSEEADTTPDPVGLFFPESLKDIFKQGQIFAPLIDMLQIFSELGGHYKIKYAQYLPQENR